MFILDCTKPDAYKNIIAIKQGQLSINNIFRCRVITGGTDDLKGFGAVTTFLVNGREIKESAKVREGSVLDIVFPGDALVEGTHSLEVILTKPGERTIQTPELTYTVWNGITTGNGIQGQSQYPVLVTLINDVTELKNECERVLGQSNTYQLPPATQSTLGGVKVGSGLSITRDGTLSAIGSSGDSVPQHNHDTQYYTKYEMDSKLQYKANASHQHSNYAKTADTYTKQEVDKKISDAQLQGGGSGSASTITWEKVTNKPSTFPPSTHNHDTQYYTESEIDNKLLEKADTTHNHDANYSAIVHSHDDRYYTETEINNKLSGKADSTHNHNNDYYSKGEVDRKIADAQLGGGSGTVDLSWGAISGKPSTFPPDAHTHTEYSASNHNHDTVYAKTTHSHTQYANSEHNHDTAYSPKTHTHDNYSLTDHTHLNYSDKNHNHNTVYYQKSEVDKLIQDAQLQGGGSGNTSWESITGKPSVFPSEPHHHDERYLNKFIVDTVTTDFNTAIEEGRYLVNGSNIAHAPETGQLKGMVIVSRNNDGTEIVQRYYGGSTRCTAYRYYIDNAWGEWYEYSFSTHDHDIRYYKKTEIDEKLAGLGSGGADVTWETLTGKPSTFPPATHAHNEYANSSHNHDSRYPTKNELTTQLSAKADITHNHDSIYAKTEHNHSNYAPSTHTHTEYASSSHNHDTSYAKSNHNHDSAYATAGHTHDNYATKSELNNVNASQINGKKVWTGTQQQYNAIGSKDANTLYFILEG